MTHLPDLIRDLGFILVTAAVVILIFRRLKQPVVLGYLIAGFLVGPHVPFIPSVTDTQSVQTWAEIGVIFLLFGLGLEFSFKKLAQVGRSATITAVFEVLSMLGLGYFLGQMFGWSNMDSLFLGGILSISSTTIIVRAVDELGLKARKFVSLVFGVLIVEDLVAILLLVLLSSVAATQTLSGSELTLTTLKLAFFLILWFVVGIYLKPIFLQKIRDLMTAETTLIVSIGLCLMMVLLASAAGFSPALGAFVMGSILAETRDGKTIEHLIVPVKDLFAAIFFVSVGMLIDPKIIYSHLGPVLIITLATIFGKFVSTTFGALLSGQRLRHSVQGGLSLAQIGEFSFIIATLGISLKVTSNFLYPIAVVVSAITTFTTPYQIKFADNIFAWIERRTPKRILDLLNDYEAALSSRTNDNLPAILWKLYGMKIILNVVVIMALTLVSVRLVFPLIVDLIGEHPAVRFGAFLVTLIACGPFFWPIVFAVPSESALNKLKNVVGLQYLQIGIVIFRVLIGILLIGFIISQFYSLAAGSGSIILISAAVFIFITRHMETVYKVFEKRFITNLRDKEVHETSNNHVLPTIAPWDATLVDFVLSPDSPLVGKTLIESRLKENYGVTLALIERGQQRILTPGRDERLYPSDRLYVIGEEYQIDAVKTEIEVKAPPPVESKAEFFGLDSLIINAKSDFVGKSIRECGLRTRINGLIVGIERTGKRILNPDSAMQLAEGDIVWLVGDKSLIRSLKSS